jgi:hypothetical protein
MTIQVVVKSPDIPTVSGEEWVPSGIAISQREDVHRRAARDSECDARDTRCVKRARMRKTRPSASVSWS